MAGASPATTIDGTRRSPRSIVVAPLAGAMPLAPAMPLAGAMITIPRSKKEPHPQTLHLTDAVRARRNARADVSLRHEAVGNDRGGDVRLVNRYGRFQDRWNSNAIGVLHSRAIG